MVRGESIKTASILFLEYTLLTKKKHTTIKLKIGIIKTYHKHTSIIEMKENYLKIFQNQIITAYIYLYYYKYSSMRKSHK